MRRLVRIIGSMTVLFFGATLLVEAVQFNDQRGMTRRLRMEREEREQVEKTAQRSEMTPEERAKWEKRRAWIKARMNKYVIHPIKKLRPRRHPEEWRTESKQQASARRKRMLKEKFGGLVPHRYPEGYSTDTPQGEQPMTEVKPATYPMEDVK